MVKEPTKDPVAVRLAELAERQAKIDAEQAEIAADIAALQRIRDRGLLPPSSGAVSAQIPASTEPPAIDGIYYGLGLAEAGVKNLSISGAPQKTKSILKALNTAGFKLLSKHPESALTWALRRRESKVGDVVLLGNATWGLTAWFTDAEVQKYRSTRTNTSTRDRDDHIERTKAGMAFARQNRGLKYGQKRKVTAEEFARCLELLRDGATADEAVASAGFSKSALNYYRYNFEVDKWKLGDAWPPPMKTKVHRVSKSGTKAASGDTEPQLRLVK